MRDKSYVDKFHYSTHRGGIAMINVALLLRLALVIQACIPLFDLTVEIVVCTKVDRCQIENMSCSSTTCMCILQHNNVVVRGYHNCWVACCDC